MSVMRFAARLLAGAASLFGASFSQEPDLSETEAARQSIAAPSASHQTQQNRYVAGQIPFDRVLTSPDDIGLNLAYIKERIAVGDLKEAASTLDRLLLVNPTLYDARVLYGFVLFRLQMYDRARFELEKALAEGAGFMPSTVVAEAQAYLDRIKRLQQRTRVSATLTAGVDYNSNRNQAPSNGVSLLLGIPLVANEKVDDIASIISLQTSVVHDRGGQAGNTLHAIASYYRSDKAEVDQLDLNAFALSAGGAWNYGDVSITPSFEGSYYRLAGADYLYLVGAAMDVLWRHGPKFRSYVRFRAEHEDFENSATFGAAENRSGPRLGARAGAQWNINPTMALDVQALAMEKTGAVAWESYDRFGAHGQHSWLLGRGAFTQIGAWAEHSDYEAADPFVTPITVRDEWLYRGRFTAGAPLSFFAPGVDMPEILETVNVIAQYEYETVDSNIANYDYDAHKVSLLFSKRFGN